MLTLHSLLEPLDAPKFNTLDLDPSCELRGPEHNLNVQIVEKHAEHFLRKFSMLCKHPRLGPPSSLQPYLQYPASVSCHSPSVDCSARLWRPPDVTWARAFD